MIKVVSVYKYYIHDNSVRETKWFTFDFEFTLNQQMPKRKSFKFLSQLKFESQCQLNMSTNENKRKYGLEFVEFKSIEEV